MADTSIEWTRGPDGTAGKTWNPVRGCTRVSAGCQRCYAETFAARNLPEMRSPTTGKPFAMRTPAGPRWTGAVELIPSKLDEPLHWRKPRRVFVNSMSDLFHEALPDEAIDQVFAVMARAPQHTFQILTKRPERMRRYFEAWPNGMGRGHHIALHMGDGRGETVALPLPNVWLGFSAEDQDTFNERWAQASRCPAAVMWCSYEPALGPVDFRGALGIGDYGPPPRRLDWIVVGGESGPGARTFDLGWARSAVAQCKAAGVKAFYKQGGASNRCPHDSKGGHFECFPDDLKVREFPDAA